MNRLRYLAFFLLILTFSCKKIEKITLKDKLIGNWGITSLVYKGKDLKNYLGTNVISLRCNSICYLPEILTSFDRDKNAKWEFNSDLSEIEIKTRNLIFIGKYDLSYFKEEDDSTAYKIKLVSANTTIEIFKISDLNCY